jgi:hypothetical protein
MECYVELVLIMLAGSNISSQRTIIQRVGQEVEKMSNCYALQLCQPQPERLPLRTPFERFYDRRNESPIASRMYCMRRSGKLRGP